MTTVLVTGASRGIGLEFVRQYLARGAQVIATCRKPEKSFILPALKTKHAEQLHIVPLDVTDAKSIEGCYQAVREIVPALNLLINNAGVAFGARQWNESEKFGNLTFDAVMKIMRVNAIAPLMVTQRFYDLLRAGRPAKVANMSSLFGSLGQHHQLQALCYGYSGSKAALNMFTMLMGRELGVEGIQTVTLDPGWVQTDMGGKHAAQTVEETVAGMIQVIEALTPEQSGGFYTWRGAPMAW